MPTPRLLALTLLAATPLAFAQGPPPPAPPAPPVIRLPRNLSRSVIINNETHSEAGLGNLPPGTWWRDPNTIKDLTLSPDQQKRLDDTFRQSRIQLIDLKASLEKEQLNLEPLLNSPAVDYPKALDEISRIADLRAGLEKANAKMLLGLRAVLTADQWTKLQSDQRSSYSLTSGKSFFFKTGEPIIHQSKTCIDNKETGMACTTTTVTPKLENGHTTLTTCVTPPGQTTPKCTTTTIASPQSFNLTLPFDAITPPPASFTIDIPRPPSLN